MADALVVGGGVGGLAAARGLQLAGWRVQVLEQAGKLEPLGAGISLWPNAVRALELLQVPTGGFSSPVGTGGVRSQDGRWLSRSDAGGYPGRYGAPLLAVHRGELQQALLGSLLPGTVVTGARVTVVDPQPDRVLVMYGGGAVSAELVVLADGLASAARHLVAGPHPRARFAGYTAWRGVAGPGGLVPRVDAAAETWGRGQRFGLVPLGENRVYWFATANTPEGEQAAEGEHAEVLRRFASWHAPIQQVVEATDAADVLRHDVYDLRPHPTSYVRGRLLLLGDAAHAMTPNLGQGACQALEDAATLSRVAPPEGVSLDAALVRYDALRRPRARRIARRSWQLGRLGQLDGPATRLRDLLVRVTPARVTDRQLDSTLDWPIPEPAPSIR